MALTVEYLDVVRCVSQPVYEGLSASLIQANGKIFERASPDSGRWRRPYLVTKVVTVDISGKHVGIIQVTPFSTDLDLKIVAGVKSVPFKRNQIAAVFPTAPMSLLVMGVAGALPSTDVEHITDESVSAAPTKLSLSSLPDIANLVAAMLQAHWHENNYDPIAWYRALVQPKAH